MAPRVKPGTRHGPSDLILNYSDEELEAKIKLNETQSLLSVTGLPRAVYQSVMFTNGVRRQTDILKDRMRRLGGGNKVEMQRLEKKLDMSEQELDLEATHMKTLSAKLNPTQQARFKDAMQKIRALEDVRDTLRVEQARRDARDAAEAWFAARTADFAQHCREQGWNVTQLLAAWPVVYVELPVGEVRRAAGHALVDEAYYCFPEVYTEQEHAQGTLRTPLVWASGLTAANSPVKTMVNDPDHVTKNNPYLPPVIWIYGNGAVGSHASACAGNIAMDDGSLRGAAAHRGAYNKKFQKKPADPPGIHKNRVESELPVFWRLLARVQKSLRPKMF